MNELYYVHKRENIGEERWNNRTLNQRMRFRVVFEASTAMPVDFCLGELKAVSAAVILGAIVPRLAYFSPLRFPPLRRLKMDATIYIMWELACK